jgi:hypothetical protein
MFIGRTFDGIDTSCLTRFIDARVGRAARKSTQHELVTAELEEKQSSPKLAAPAFHPHC